MNKFRHVIRVITAALFATWLLKRNSKRLRKWLKKNEREQDETLYDFDKRWIYAVKKSSKLLKRMGIKVELIGKENLTKGTYWITPNHTSNLDGFYLSVALGDKIQFSPISKEELRNDKKINGFLNSANGFYIDRTNIRQMASVLDNAGQYAKHSGKSVVIFPEGTRSLTTDVHEYKPGAFKIAQKYYLPILPITILGTLQAKQWWKLKTRVVQVKVGKPWKASEHSRIDTIKVAQKIQETAKNNIEKYNDSLESNEKEKFLKLKEKASFDQQKIDAKLKKQIENKVST